MKLMRDDEVPTPPGLQSYQETQWAGLAVGVALCGATLIAAFTLLAGEAWRSPWIFSIACLCAIIVLLIGRYALKTFFASRRPKSWRLRWNAEGLYLRYRSYLNDRFPADTLTVLHLHRREIGWLRAREETLESPNEHGGWSRTRKHFWMEIAVKNLELTPVREALAKEAKLRNSSGGRVNDYPLGVTSDGTLRLQLNRPRKVVHLLQRHYPVLSEKSSTAVGFDKMSRAQREDLVLALASAGDTFAAVKAAREVYGLDLKEAKEFVESLRR